MHQFKLILDTSNEYTGQIVNWNDLMPVLAMNDRYRTIIPAFTINKIELCKEAALYIKQKYEARGVLAKTLIKIERYDGSSWQNYLEGLVDYASYDPDESQLKVSVGLKQVDLVSKWLKRDEIDISLQDLTDLDNNLITAFTNETVDVNMHNQIYDLFVDADIESSVTLNRDLNNVGAGFSSYESLFQLGTERTTINEISDEYFNIPIAHVIDGVTVDTDDVTPFMQLERDPNTLLSYQLEIEYDIDYSLTGNSNSGPFEIFASFYYKKFDGISGDSTLTIKQDSVKGVKDPTHGSIETISGNWTGTLSNSVKSSAGINPLDLLRLFLVARIDNDGSGDAPFDLDISFTINTLDISVAKAATYPETSCKSMLVYEAFLRSIQKITGVNDPLRSDFYGRTDSEVHAYASDGIGSMRAISNGFGVRQFPITERPIYTNFFELFQVFNALDNIGVGVIESGGNKYIKIEPIEYFKDNSQVAFTITDPAGFKEYPALQYLFSQVKFGNTNYEQQKESILRSPHTPRIYTTGLDEVIKNDYNIENPAICSGHLIEQLRQQPYIEGGSKDTQYDNNLVVIAVRKISGNWISEKDEDFNSVAGIEYPEEQYNLKLTPLRSLLSHTNILFGGAKRFNDDAGTTDKQLRFQKGLGNIELTTQLTSEGSSLEEKEDIQESEGNTPILIPDYQEFKYPLTQSQWNSLLSNPNQVITVNWRGLTKKGYLEMCKVRDGNSLEAEFKTVKVYEP